MIVCFIHFRKCMLVFLIHVPINNAKLNKSAGGNYVELGYVFFTFMIAWIP